MLSLHKHSVQDEHLGRMLNASDLKQSKWKVNHPVHPTNMGWNTQGGSKMYIRKQTALSQHPTITRLKRVIV
jgi:hypothetical protein